MNCDTGEPMPVAVIADATVTFAAVKKGFLSPGAARYTGTVYVASIGIEPPRPGLAGTG
jgi:NAD(P)H-hydrate epimerase